MNDLDLNKAVADKLGYQYQIGSEEDDTESGVYLVHQGVVFLEFNTKRDLQDAGPIIEKYKINITYREKLKNWVANNHNTFSPPGDEPLKLAMLCFLEMEI